MTRAKFSTVVLWLLNWTALALDDAKVLTAIGLVESGMKREAVGDYAYGKPTAFGCYQLHAESWEDGNEQLMREGFSTWSFSAWKNPIGQDMVAAAYLRLIRLRLRNRGITNPSIELLALCWNQGTNKAIALGFNYKKAKAVKVDYCDRVGNVYRDLIK